ncbi:hypothetical protein BDN72DRAFT_838626 [Pluteus cervinus]|uniref:Uncharacterized protein n=1 Tax=Pluteus cervinus TaxID=181527 RepID=A0ACD3AXY0_9AGAR|nr:hypothetical protein BDN72DRAFT_838626 [Pluteus cervinus]
MVDFPPEIIETFLAYLNEDSPERHTYLSGCCLVSRSWCCIAQPLLFSTVRMTRSRLGFTGAQASAKRGIQTLLKTLEESPHIRKYIHTLCTDIDVPTGVSVTSLLRLLIDLRRLRLIMPYPAPPTPFPQDFLSFIPGLFQSERFISLSLTRLENFPVGLFAHCVALRELALSCVTFSGLDAPPPEKDRSHGPRPQLRSIVLFNVVQEEIKILSWLIKPSSSFDLTKLTTFIAMDRSDSLSTHRLVCEFVSFASNSLENLLIDQPTDAQSLGMLQVDGLVNLRSLTVWLLQDVDESINLLPAILDILKRLPNPGGLQEVELSCELSRLLGNQDEVSSSTSVLHSLGWSDFDSLLSSSAFHNLRSMKITAYDVDDISIGLQYLDLFTSTLPALFEGDKLCVAATTEDDYLSRQEQVWFA